MVRSKGEDNARALLQWADEMRAAEKYFDVSLPEIERQLTATGCWELTCEQEVTDENGETVAAVLRLNISCKSRHPAGWTIALKLCKERIDGIDRENRYDAMDGTEKSGWHRHVWDSRTQSAKEGKQPIQGFDDPRLTRSDFLVRAFSAMRVLVSRHDHGNSDLPFD